MTFILNGPHGGILEIPLKLKCARDEIGDST